MIRIDHCEDTACQGVVVHLDGTPALCLDHADTLFQISRDEQDSLKAQADALPQGASVEVLHYIDFLEHRGADGRLVIEGAEVSSLIQLHFSAVFGVTIDAETLAQVVRLRHYVTY